jgi:hypothetical protein
MHRTAWLFGLASIAIVTTTRPAHALGSIDLEVGAKAGVGTNPYSGSGGLGGLNPLGFGLGGRAGVVLFDHLYGGVNLMYYLGESGSSGSSFNGGSFDLSAHTLMYGVEAGWGFKLLDILTIRPQVGLGNASFSFTASCPASSPGCALPAAEGSPNSLYVEPGVTALLALGTLFVGADANALVFPGLAGSNAAFTAHGQVGLKF